MTKEKLKEAAANDELNAQESGICRSGAWHRFVHCAGPCRHSVGSERVDEVDESAD